MAENNEQDESKPLFNKHEAQRIQDIPKEKALKAKYLDEINNNEIVNKYLQPFNGASAKWFKEDYAELKANYDQDQEWYFKKKEQIDLLFIDKAKEMIWCIQQKKLFDHQCLWRAGNIELPEILISRDYDYWSENIKQCTFIDPIEEDEVELLQKFIIQPSYEEGFLDYSEWQDYDTYKKEHLGDPESLCMPEWYHFYNMRRGTEALLLLPDVKKTIEKEYTNAGINSYSKEEKDKLFTDAFEDEPLDPAMEADEDDPLPYRFNSTNYVRDDRPHLYSSFENYEKFINLFEDNMMKEMHEVKKNLRIKTELSKWDIIELDDSLKNLRYAGKNYPMQPYHCWRQAIHKLWQQYNAQRIHDALPLVFEEYQLRLKMGIAPHLTNREKDSIQKEKKHAELYRNFYRTGKKIIE